MARIVPFRLRPAAMLCALLLAAPAAAREVETYAIDPDHTRVVVAVDHAGFSRALGAVSGARGTIVIATEPTGIDWGASRVEVEVPLAGLDFGAEAITRAVLGRGFLDAGRHPQARFVGTGTEATADNQARVCGELTLRGVTRPLCLDVRLNALKRHPLPPFRRTAGFSATATLDRTGYGIDAWPTVVGHTVEMRIEVEATLDRSAAREDTP